MFTVTFPSFRILFLLILKWINSSTDSTEIPKTTEKFEKNSNRISICSSGLYQLSMLKLRGKVVSIPGMAPKPLPPAESIHFVLPLFVFK